jgi:hypothetical protein
MTGEPIIVKIVSEATTGGGGGTSTSGNQFASSVFSGNTREIGKVTGTAIGNAIAPAVGGAIGGAIGGSVGSKLKISDIIAFGMGPLVFIGKKIAEKVAENSQLMKGMKKVTSEAFGGIGDIITYAFYTFYNWIKSNITEILTFVQNPALYIGEAMADWLMGIDWASIFKKMKISDLIEGVISIWDYITTEVKDISKFISDTAIDIWDYINNPKKAISDLFNLYKKFNLDDYIALPNFSVTKIFDTNTTFDLKDYIKLPYINPGDLFMKGVKPEIKVNVIPQVTAPSGKKMGLIEYFQELAYAAGGLPINIFF